MPDYKITKAGTNSAGLVSGLKFLLNATNTDPKNPLTIDEKLDKTTFARASAISTLYGYGDTLNTVSTRTLVNLTKKFQAVVVADAAIMAVLPDWLARLARAAAGTALSAANFRADQFLAMYKENFNEYMPSGSGWEDNFRRFVNFIFADTLITDRRWAAYLMATAMHEGRAAADKWKATWNPVSETNGANLSYGGLETVVDWEGNPVDTNGTALAEVTDGALIKKLGAALINMPKRGKNHYYPRAQIVRQRYYGRGYVQITHQENYRGMDEALILNGALLANPEIAVTNAQVSYNTASYGLVNGSFRGSKRHVAGQGIVGGHKLVDYIANAAKDYVAARDIVNGDRAANGALIAGYAETFEAMFDVCLS